MGRVKRCYVCDEQDEEDSLFVCHCGKSFFCEYHVLGCFGCGDETDCYCPFCRRCAVCPSECPGVWHECSVCGCLFDDGEEKFECDVCKDFVYHQECTSVCVCGCGKVLCKAQHSHKCAEQKCTKYLCTEGGDYKDHLCDEHK